jgi:hypothetical protein
LHGPASPNTGLGGGHDHSGHAGAGGGHTPTEIAKAHKHQTDGTLTIKFGELYINSASRDEEGKSNVHGGNHHHTNPITGYNDVGHTHYYSGSTGSSDSDATALTSVTGWGASCATGWCVMGFYNKTFALSDHGHGFSGTTNTQSANHTHTQGNTGDTSPTMYIEIDTTSVVFTIHPYVFGELSSDEDPAHLHTINSVSDHNDHGIDTLSDFSLSVPGTDTEPDFSLDLNYGMKEIPGGTIMELFVRMTVMQRM